MASCECKTQSLIQNGSNYIKDLEEAYKKSLLNKKDFEYSKLLLKYLNDAKKDEVEIKPLTDFERFLNKLDKCKKNPSVIAGKFKTESGVFSQVYKDKDLTKPLIHPISCKCAYCNKLSCMDLRKKEAHIFLKPYFEYAKKNNWKCSHAVFGFPRIRKEEITKDIIKQMRIKMQKCRKEIIGKNNLLRVVGVQDLSYDKTDNTYYFHWHMAVFFPSWHRGNLKYKEIRDITKKYNMTFTRFENNSKQDKLFKNPIKVLDYISKRFAGILEHPSQEEGLYSKYSDFFTEEEYFNLFHREKRLFTWGYSKKEREFLISQARKDFLCSIIGNNEYFYIAENESVIREQIVFFIEDASNFKKPDIPPGNSSQTLEIEYIKVRFP